MKEDNTAPSIGPIFMKKKEKRKTNVEPNDKVFLFIKKEFLMTTLFRKRKQKCKYITFKYHQERDIKLIIMER
jgi:hypothetical protein